MDFPQLTMTLPDGREESIMKRTTLVRTNYSRPRPCLMVSQECKKWSLSPCIVVQSNQQPRNWCMRPRNPDV